MNYNDCIITINPCQAHGWRDWWDYTVTQGQQSIEGRSRGTKREIVSDIKWRIDHNEMFPTQKAVELASPPNGARDTSEVLESKDESLCIKCGKRKRYKRNGRVFALCAVCGWNNLKEFLDLPDTRHRTTDEADLPQQDLACTCDKVKFYPWENVVNETCPVHGNAKS